MTVADIEVIVEEDAKRGMIRTLNQALDQMELEKHKTELLGTQLRAAKTALERQGKEMEEARSFVTEDAIQAMEEELSDKNMQQCSADANVICEEAFTVAFMGH